MATYGAVIVVTASVTFFTVAANGSALQVTDEEGTLQHFRDEVVAYMILHDAVERAAAPLDLWPDAEGLQLAVEERATAIRAARPSAKEGEIFDTAVGTVFRRRIQEAIRLQHCGVADILAAERDDDRPPRPLRPLVHDRFEWGWGSFMPPCVLAVLPALPDGLQFRFVEHDLVLVDVDADLVIDVLPDALPASESWQGVHYARRPSPAVRDVCVTA